LQAAAVPDPGQIFAFVVTGESQAGGEGTPGNNSTGPPRYLQGACGPLMRTHALNRAGFGWDEWSRDRIVALGGIQPFLDEQLDPSLISEASNSELINKLAIYDPALDGFDLIARHVLHSVYARRQLEHKMGMFWWNHFNTEWIKVAGLFLEKFPDCAVSSVPECDGNYPFKGEQAGATVQRADLDRFKDLAFNGTFRQMLEAATLSPAMLIYLDLHTSIAIAPNENQPRELLELHSMSPEAGYTQGDVEELSRLLTGWNVCKKTAADAGDPLAPCIPDYWAQSGLWVANFDILNHDCDSKTLFVGTPQETNFPGTSSCNSQSDKNAAMPEFQLALDVIAAHSSTRRFISKKILQLLVTDEPTQAMIDQMMLVWNDGGNPNGVGDLREVTREALSIAMDPAYAGTKIKTPFEQFVTSLRTLNGITNGTQEILIYLSESKHLPFFNEIPTGYSEAGGDWVSTGGVLSRQNWGVELATAPPSTTFYARIINLLNNNGISTAPGNATEIVDFLVEILFGGALTQQERQTAIDYLNTDATGNPSPYDDTRIHQTVFLLLGYPQFMEQ
jgi:uncharacterized protein (DUF1800 family)